MKQFYLPLLLSLFCTCLCAQSVLDPADTVVEYNPDNPPVEPAWGQIGKWVRTKRLNWNTDEYKCYIYKGCAFRLHFPKTYDPTTNDGKKYPLLVYFHGLGETAGIYENENQLYHGGDVFQKAINSGKYDGYVLCMQSTGFWGSGHYQYITELINYMVANNKVDPFHITDNGYSAGGQGAWEMMLNYPSYICAALPMSNVQIGYKDASVVNVVKFTPIWLFQGGKDGAPSPSTAQQVRDAMVSAGGNFTYTEFSTLGHGVWDSAWKMTDFWPFQLRAYASNPWVLNGRTKFCPNDTIRVTMGVAPGFEAYQWRYNGSIINNATSNTITATKVGVYDARVKRNGIWSDWSRTPVEIIMQASSVTPPIEIAGTMSRVIPAADGKNYVTLKVSGNNTYTGYAWKKLGSDSIYCTEPTFNATQPGYYTVTANQQYSCLSLPSQPFKVINANGLLNTPANVKNILANALPNTQVQLSWSYAQSGGATALEIYRGTKSGNYNYIGQVVPSIKTYIDSGLSPRMNYYYVIRAVDSTGASALSDEASVITYSDTIPPSIPQNLVSTYTTPSSISIAWDASTDNAIVDHYAIYVDGKLSNVTSKTSFVLTALNEKQPYAITVKAVDASGNYSSASNQITSAPVLGGLQYKFYTTEIPWSVLPDFSKLIPVKTGVSSNVNISVGTQTTNCGYLWQGYIRIPVNGTYVFQTTSNEGSALWFNSFEPIGVPTVNNDGIHTTKSKSSSKLTLAAGIYPICIEFFNASGYAGMSVSWSCMELFGDNTQRAIANQYFKETYVAEDSTPAAPTNVSATAIAFDKVNLSWKDNSSNETGFEIYRSMSFTEGYTIVAVTPANVTTYMDSGLLPSTTYYYKVQAINKYGNSGLSTGIIPDTISNGLTYKYYVGTWTSTPGFSSLTPTGSGTISNFTMPESNGKNFGYLYQGVITIPATGNYTFYTKSNSGSNLYIGAYAGSNRIVTNTFDSEAQEKSGTKKLNAGTYPIYVSYYFNNKTIQNTGDPYLSVSYKGPDIPKQEIPDNAFIQFNPSATTFSLPAAPAAPASFKATAASAYQINLTWNASTNATGYELTRSIGDTLNYVKLANVGAATKSYIDSGLNANLIHYYKIKAIGAGGSSSVASKANATTKNNTPVITKLNATAVPYGITSTIPLNGTDPDGDILTYSSSGLPSFARIVNSDGNSASLVVNPAQSNMGVYSNIKIVVNDGHNGKDSTIFTLTVNDNYPPTIDSIADYSLNENETVNIALTAHDVNSSDVLTWSVSNVPDTYTLTNNGNGLATLTLHPNYLAAGTYFPVVTVNDGKGGVTSRSFKITVNDLNPNVTIYARFQYIDTIGAPWNSITQAVTKNLKDASGNTTNIGLVVQGSWFTTFNTGSPTGNNSGIYPDAVLSDYLYFGIFGGPETLDTKITGLDTSKLYNLTFFASSTFPGTPDNGSTIYTVGNISDTLYVQGNTKHTVSLRGIKPQADGTITYKMSKNVDAAVGYINALVINYTYDDGKAPASATNLAAEVIDGKGVQLNWKDVAYNESGYYIYRATTPNGVYTIIDTTGADAISFTDVSINGNTQYFYKVAAYNSHGVSEYSDIATVTTTNRIPQITALSDVALKSGQMTTVNITVNDDITDNIKIAVNDLPSFATFVDNGNGTAKITITPTSNNLGVYPVTVKATDNAGASTSTSFNILVSDPNISSTYLSFSDGVRAVPKPWNMLAGYPFAGTSFSNIYDDSNTPTGMTVKYKNGFSGVVQSGAQPVEGAGIYPNVVMRTAVFEQGAKKDTIQISGLSSSKKYNFVFFNSHDDGLNGNTNFTIGATTVTLNATNNISKTVQINGITPTNGIVNVVVQKAAGADYAFLSTMIIQSYASNYTTLAPTNLRTTTVTRNSIGLQWEDRAYSETGYQVWRAADSTSSYTLLATVAAGVTKYIDVNLTPNKTYHYAVRAVLGTNKYSGFSNPVKASTYAYSVYINYNNNNNYGALPWNNTSTLPQEGYVWNNFFDEKGFTTSTGMELTSGWAGMYTDGMTMTNNSGIVPDQVMIDSYGLFPGETATFNITGLNIGMKYNFSFFASSKAYGDVNVAYTINGVTTILNASLNVNGIQTIYDVTPDERGNVTITVGPATQTSQFGLLGALIINAYTPSVSTAVPQLPDATQQSATVISSSITKPLIESNEPELKIYPNPFHDYFNLQLAVKTKGKYTMNIYDINGRLVYTNVLADAFSGKNTFRIQPGEKLSAGIYMVVIINTDTKTTKTIKLMKE